MRRLLFLPPLLFLLLLPLGFAGRLGSRLRSRRGRSLLLLLLPRGRRVSLGRRKRRGRRLGRLFLRRSQSLCLGRRNRGERLLALLGAGFRLGSRLGIRGRF